MVESTCLHPQECCPGHRSDGGEYCHQEGCDHYIPRPTHLDKLVESAQEVINILGKSELQPPDLALAKADWEALDVARGKFGSLVKPELVLNLVEAARALEGTGWRDSDGPCWCPEAVELTGLPHMDRCARARHALEALKGRNSVR